jgi:IS5 family transposase
MKQISFADANSGFQINRKRTRKQIFLEEMDTIVPWKEMVELIKPYAPHGEIAKQGRPPFPIETMIRIHFMQQWFGLSDPAMEENLHDIFLYRNFAQLDPGITRLPDESTILRFRHLLEEHKLAHQILQIVNQKLGDKNLILREGTSLDATLICAPSSTKNKTGNRDPDMHSTKKGNNYYFGMKAHIGVDSDSGLVHTVTTTPANDHDITQAHQLLHGKEKLVLGDSAYTGIEKRPEIQEKIKKTKKPIEWFISMKPGKRKQVKEKGNWGKMIDQAEKIKSRMRSNVEFPFRVLKCQFGYRKVRYKGLIKNTLQIVTLFALSNLFMARKKLIGV